MIPYPARPLAEGRVQLRPWTADDLPLVEEAAKDVDFLTGTTLPRVYTSEEGLEFIRRQLGRQETGQGVSLCITADGHPVGCATLLERRPRVADLGYWLLARTRGMGLGGTAVKLLCEWASALEVIDALEAFVADDNLASRRLLERIGFREIGVRTHQVNDLTADLRAYRLDI